MTEQQVKFFCKWVIENSNRPLTDTEKELLKQAVDQAKNIDELLGVALSATAEN